MGDAGVAAHERVQLGEEWSEELGAVAPRQARRPGLAPHRLHSRHVARRTEEEHRGPPGAEQPAELHDARGIPDLGAAVRRAQVDADAARGARGLGHPRLAHQRTHAPTLGRRRVGRYQARLADVDRDAEALDEPRVFVHLVKTGLGQLDRVGEEPAPPTHREADPPARSPVERRCRRLERGWQKQRRVATEAPYGVGGGETPAPRARIRDEHVGERLAAEDRRPRARQQEPPAVERLAEGADRGHRHHGVPQPVWQANDHAFGHARSKADRQRSSPVVRARRIDKT